MFLLYEFVSDNFVNYYSFSKPHFCNKNNSKIIKNRNEENTINIGQNNLIFDESKKSTLISFYIEESENNSQLNEFNKDSDNSKNIEIKN